MSDQGKWKVESSKYVVENRWLKLREEACRTAEGRLIEPYYVMEYPEWANCLVVDNELNAILVRQYRHGTQEFILELVAGWIDPDDKTPELAIKRELAEEIGYSGGEVFQTGLNYTNPAYMTNKNHSFLAVGGAFNLASKLGEGESTLQVEKIPLQDLWLKAGRSGRGEETLQSYHLANIFLAQQFIRDSEADILAPLKSTLPR